MPHRYFVHDLLSRDPASAAERVAVDRLVREHMPLVGHLVRELTTRVPSHVDRDDLMGAGLTALVMAAQAWQSDRGVSFAKYATLRVRGALLDDLRRVDWASRRVRRRARELDQTRARVAVELGRNPTDVELSHAAGLTIGELSAHAEDVCRAAVLSVQSFVDGEVDDMVSSHAPAADVLVARREQHEYLRDAVDTLPDRLRTIVQGTFFDDRTLVDLAAELGVSESRVCQLRVEALALLKEAMNHAFDPDLVTPETRPGGCAARRRESYFAQVASHRTFRQRLTPSLPPSSSAQIA